MISLRLDTDDVATAIKEAKAGLKAPGELSPEFRASVEKLVEIATKTMGYANLNSQNSSLPPSFDPNRKKKKNGKSVKSSGGQKGHKGSTLKRVEHPDQIIPIKLKSKNLPQAKSTYQEAEPETRQVIDIKLSRQVIEYQAQVLVNAQGKRFVAPFPKEVTKAVQYGKTLKAHAVYLSQHQLIPYARLSEYFSDQVNLPISEGSLYNFTVTAYKQLEAFEDLSKRELAQAAVNHADETGINIGGEGHWLHCASNSQWTHYFPHKRRGKVAMDEAGILPDFKGILCHDHWKTYYQYPCLHALCNAHHLRELTRAEEQDKQQWATQLKKWLIKTYKAVEKAGGALTEQTAKAYRAEYNALLKKAEKECPPPEQPPPGKRKQGPLKRTRPRNLLERLLKYQDDVLRFMENASVPFTNNAGERDIRMTKVHQKISGCFRSMPGAHMFCRIRGYLSTCRKQHVSASQALNDLFNKRHLTLIAQTA